MSAVSDDVAHAAIQTCSAITLEKGICELAIRCNWRMGGKIPTRIMKVANADPVENATQKENGRVSSMNEFNTTAQNLIILASVLHVYLTATCSEGDMLACHSSLGAYLSAFA